MVDVLLLCREHGPDRVALAVRGALAAGAIDGRAVAVLARRAASTPAVQVPPLTGLDVRLARTMGPPRTTSPTTTSSTERGRTMIGPEPYCALEAFIEPDKLDWRGDLAPRHWSP